MRIKEAADLLGASARSIRFYEEKGLIHPKKDKDNQYRFFEEEDLERLRNIIALREIGMPLTRVKEVLSQLDVGETGMLLSHLERQRSAMVDEWAKLRDAVETTEKMIDTIKTERSPSLTGLHDLASRLKALKSLRKNWKDRWDFDSQAEHYDQQVYRSNGYFNVHQDYDKALDLTFEWIAAQPSEMGLDIGTGTGNLAGRFMKSGITMHGIDQSEKMLLACKRKYPAIHTKLGHFLALPYDGQPFDFVVTSYALHHVNDDQKELALLEMSRVLKRKGRLCIADLMFENRRARSQYLQQ